MSGYQFQVFLQEELKDNTRLWDIESTTFIATGLSPGTEYHFRVAAVNSEGAGEFSPFVTVKTTPDNSRR